MFRVQTTESFIGRVIRDFMRETFHESTEWDALRVTSSIGYYVAVHFLRCQPFPLLLEIIHDHIRGASAYPVPRDRTELYVHEAHSLRKIADWRDAEGHHCSHYLILVEVALDAVQEDGASPAMIHAEIEELIQLTLERVQQEDEIEGFWVPIDDLWTIAPLKTP